MNTPHERISINAVMVAGFCVFAIVTAVAVALVFDALWTLIGGVFLALSLAIVAGWMIARNIVVPLLDAKTKRDGMRYDFLQNMAAKGVLPNNGEYVWRNQIAAPAEPQEQKRPQIATVDPRHDLLVNLCLLTIKSEAEGYGPTSKRLMTANDAQADRSGLFADRMNWDAASKYGQEIGYLFVQQGGKPDEQGLKIDCGNNGKTVSDLLVALHNRNSILDSSVNALPGVSR